MSGQVFALSFWQKPGDGASNAVLLSRKHLTPRRPEDESSLQEGPCVSIKSRTVVLKLNWRH